MSASVTTRSYDNYRTGANLQETTLTALAVQKRGIKLLAEIQLPDDARGSEGMPLIVPGLTMDDGAQHEVLFVATMYNDVLAYDTTTFELLWKQHVGEPIKGTKKMDMFQINDHWGILSTPCIDLKTRTIYVCSMTSETNDFNQSNFYLHALSLTDGSQKCAPLSLNEATYTVETVNGKTRTSKMGAVSRKQRCGLLFDSVGEVDTVFVANGSFLESADTNQGWVIACDVSGLRSDNANNMMLGAAWTTTNRFSGGGIWMGGQGPSMSDAHEVFGTIGNGSFDGVTDFGESFYCLEYTPPEAEKPLSGRLQIVEWFTPFTDTGRVGGDPTLPDVSLIPGGQEDPGGSSNMDDPGDEDLNSGGPLYLPKGLTGFDRDLVLGAGKDGILYVIDALHMGSPGLHDFAPDKIEQNVYGKLLMPPYGFTYYPGDMDVAPTDLSKLETTHGGFTHHQHSTPVFYKSPRFGNMLLTGGENGPVRAFSMAQVNGAITMKYLGCGSVIASLGVPPPGGMPGTMMTLSANGNQEDTAVLWCLNPYGDANKTISPGRLVAYGADWITADGELVKIWDSQDWGITFMHNKFNIPSVCNGKMYVCTYDARILVFGLA